MEGLRRPLGLVLAGGGAHGSWQAGCLDAWERSGLVFDKILGFSAGALTGAAYLLGRGHELLERWRNIDGQRILRLRPRLRPFSLFSPEPVLEAVGYAADEERALRTARCDLVVVSVCVEDGLPHYARFTPRGERGWDGPLAVRLAASCAIPWVFPPVRVGGNGTALTFIDGGVRSRASLRLDDFAGCRDVIVVQMVRPEEFGRRRLWPLARRDQRGRDLIHRNLASAAESAAGLPHPPRLFRFFPSRSLDFSMLSFRTRHCAPAVELGIADGEAFLREPERHLLPAL